MSHSIWNPKLRPKGVALLTTPRVSGQPSRIKRATVSAYKLLQWKVLSIWPLIALFTHSPSNEITPPFTWRTGCLFFLTFTSSTWMFYTGSALMAGLHGRISHPSFSASVWICPLNSSTTSLASEWKNPCPTLSSRHSKGSVESESVMECTGESEDCDV